MYKAKEAEIKQLRVRYNILRIAFNAQGNVEQDADELEGESAVSSNTAKLTSAISFVLSCFLSLLLLMNSDRCLSCWRRNGFLIFTLCVFPMLSLSFLRTC